MSASIRVLLADDSAVVRRLLKETFSSHPDIEVVATAPNGQIMLSQIDSARPDVVVLDVEMPVMDGITALKILRAKDRFLPVVMFSAKTVSGARATLDALSLGASDYVSKPTGTGHVQAAIQYVNDNLVPLIRQWGGRSNRARNNPIKLESKPKHVNPEPEADEKMDGKRTSASVVAIGASTGGPNALATVLSGLPARLAVPVLIVQHMPAVFTAMLAERLDKSCPLRVREAHDGAVLEAGDVWIAPGDFHMTVCERDGQVVLKTSQAAAENSCRPSVDVLFRSVVDVYGERTLGVILTGMGKDGFAGCRRISQAGGYVVAQDEESSVVWGMPRVVAEAGVANRVRPLSRIAVDITTGVSVAGSMPTLTAGAAR